MNNAKNEQLVKIADHLYEITFTDDFDWDNSYLPVSKNFGCSAVQNGKYRGRNYDWVYSNTDLCIIHAKKSPNRPHASVGVADLGFGGQETGSINYSKIPFVTVDGINDAGVCIQVNIIPFGENGVIKHTEATSDDLAVATVVRYVLDYADSVNMAINLLKEKDIHSEIGTAKEAHWMISGPTSKEDKTLKTVVVEVFPDGIHFTEKFVDNKPIMTNLNVSNFNGTPASVGYGFGYERWQILAENFDEANSIMGTFDLMKKIHFSNFYDLYGERFWYSEYNGVNLLDYYTEKELRNLIGDDKYERLLTEDGTLPYLSELWDGEQQLKGDASKAGILSRVVEQSRKDYDAQNMENGSLWITVHTSVYDLENKTLDIQVREAQDHLRFTIE